MKHGTLVLAAVTVFAWLGILDAIEKETYGQIIMMLMVWFITLLAAN